MNQKIYNALYSSLLYILSPIISGYFLWRMIRSQEYRQGFGQRLGLVNPDYPQRSIVIHCASVGEAKAALPLIQALTDRYPLLPITVTTTTPTGKQALLDGLNLVSSDDKKSLQSQPQKITNPIMHCYLPIDWPGSCRRFLNRLDPQLVILMETEIWPNLLDACTKRKIPLMLANARLSQKSLERYLKWPNFSNALFKNITHIVAQYASDQRNFLKLGVSGEQITLAGSVKFEINCPPALIEQQQQLKSLWAKQRPVWAAVSIHPTEFDAVLKAHTLARQTMPELLLVAVPRHPEKFENLKQTCTQAGIQFVSRSDNLVPDANTAVVVGDTMGEVLLFCGLADVVYVGGSLIDRGGHNPLEPIACGKPVVMGPHFENFAAIGELLIENGLMTQVSSSEELAQAVVNLVSDRQRLAAIAGENEQLLTRYGGSVAKTVEQVEKFIEIEI